MRSYFLGADAAGIKRRWAEVLVCEFETEDGARFPVHFIRDAAVGIVPAKWPHTMRPRDYGN